MAARRDPVNNFLDSLSADPFTYGSVQDVWLMSMQNLPDHQKYVTMLKRLKNIIEDAFVDLNLTHNARVLAHEIFEIGLCGDPLEKGEITIYDAVGVIAKVQREVDAITRVYRQRNIHEKSVELVILIFELGTQPIIDLVRKREEQKQIGLGH
jgi:hypothetical protein